MARASLPCARARERRPHQGGGNTRLGVRGAESGGAARGPHARPRTAPAWPHQRSDCALRSRGQVAARLPGARKDPGRVRLASRAQPRSAGRVVPIHRPDAQSGSAAEAVVQHSDQPPRAGGQQARMAGVPDRAKSPGRSTGRSKDVAVAPQPRRAGNRSHRGRSGGARHEPPRGRSGIIERGSEGPPFGAGRPGTGRDCARSAAGRVPVAHGPAGQGPERDGARGPEVARPARPGRVDPVAVQAGSARPHCPGRRRLALRRAPRPDDARARPELRRNALTRSASFHTTTPAPRTRRFASSRWPRKPGPAQTKIWPS